MTISRAKMLEKRLEHLKDSKISLIRSSINSSISQEDISATVGQINIEIEELEQEISSTKNLEKDFAEFVTFTMNLIDGMQDNFWDLDEEHMGWCKQLLFPAGFSVTRDGKVYTPILSEFYRLVSK